MALPLGVFFFLSVLNCQFRFLLPFIKGCTNTRWKTPKFHLLWSWYWEQVIKNYGIYTWLNGSGLLQSRFDTQPVLVSTDLINERDFSTALSQKTKTQLIELAVHCQFRKKPVIFLPYIIKAVLISRKHLTNLTCFSPGIGSF